MHAPSVGSPESRMFEWIGRDSQTILGVRALRTFGQSAIALLLALYLGAMGLGLPEIGLVLSLDIAGTAAMAMVVALLTNRIGRKRMLIVIMLMAAAASLAVGLTHSLAMVAVAVFFGSFTAGAGAGGPAQPLELASLSEVVPGNRRTRLISLGFIAGQAATALGSLVVGLPLLFQQRFGSSELAAYQLVFLGYAALQALCALLYFCLTPAIEGPATIGQWSNPLRLKSRRRIFTLTALFSIDSFAASLVVQSLIAYWFTARFGLNLAGLSAVFFVSSVFSAISLWAAAKIADRIGLVNTMVLAHTPANLLLIAAAFSPVAWLAVLFWLLRSMVASMDAPTRESYTMAVVEPNERVAMAGIHGVGRSVAGIVGPSLGTALWTSFSVATPFVISGILRVVYDAALYITFRNVRPPEEATVARKGALPPPQG